MTEKKGGGSRWAGAFGGMEEGSEARGGKRWGGGRADPGVEEEAGEVGVGMRMWSGG